MNLHYVQTQLHKVANADIMSYKQMQSSYIIMHEYKCYAVYIYSYNYSYTHVCTVCTCTYIHKN